MLKKILVGAALLNLIACVDNSPPMTQVVVKLCGEKDCQNWSSTYWGKVQEKDIKLEKFVSQSLGMEYYLLTVDSPKGCLPKDRTPIEEKQSMALGKLEQKIGKLSPRIENIYITSVEEEKQKQITDLIETDSFQVTRQMGLNKGNCKPSDKAKSALKFMGFQEF